MPFTRDQIDSYAKAHISEHGIACPGCRKADALAVVVVIISPVLTAKSALEVYAKPDTQVFPELVLRCQHCASTLHLESIPLFALWRDRYGDPDAPTPPTPGAGKSPALVLVGGNE